MPASSVGATVDFVRADGVDRKAALEQRADRVTTDEPASAREQYARHQPSKSANALSRAVITSPPGGGGGHSIAKAGSSKRTPRAASGT